MMKGSMPGDLKKSVVFSLIVMVICSFLYHVLWTGTAQATFAKADKVVVIKSKRILLLMNNGEILRTYKVALGGQPVGHKTGRGDERTPEGTYVLDARNPNSKYHLAIHVSYPNEFDTVKAQELGTSPGGDIMIHGLPPKLARLGKTHRFWDWTKGCIAVTNEEIEEIWQMVPNGTPIEIKP